jgi:ABC-type arginine/histidine transport system permease subunit
MEVTSILLQMTCKKYKVQLIFKSKNIIYLSVNKVLIIHFENISNIYIRYT